MLNRTNQEKRKHIQLPCRTPDATFYSISAEWQPLSFTSAWGSCIADMHYYGIFEYAACWNVSVMVALFAVSIRFSCTCSLLMFNPAVHSNVAVIMACPRRHWLSCSSQVSPTQCWRMNSLPCQVQLTVSAALTCPIGLWGEQRKTNF